MENARHLDERLKRIIREVSIRTGGEINKTLLHDFAHSTRVVLEEHCRQETTRFLALFKNAVDKI
ncbi:MAG: hypothetical protein BWY65_01404 [Firmicutes bacterium ADurb.Bin373]|nr:hypothetical protein [Bacillota bacterium]OQA08670.1 MAG: hypothetical protein BWY65_01404 [Firmicutes bacterium ADurb.Bin373]